LVNYSGGSAPGPAGAAPAGYQSLHAAIAAELVVSCHDLSEGGLAVAAAEMAIGGDLGVDVSLRLLPRTPDVINSATAAFSESLGRFLIEVRPGHEARFEVQMAGYPVSVVGRVRSDGAITITGLDDAPFITTDVASVTRAWRQHLEPGT
jgi:phosphoribosylformylglycinamidine synthase